MIANFVASDKQRGRVGRAMVLGIFSAGSSF